MHTNHGLVPGNQAGYLWSWWQGDALPHFPAVQGWRVEVPQERRLLMQVCDLTEQELEARLSYGHRAYFGYMGNKLVAFGWSARNNAAFGSPSVHFQVPPHNLYLYHFLTMYKQRGRGFYPRLLQEVIQYESNSCDRFWIIHQHENIASRRGIAKAGFSIATSVFHTADKSRLVLVAGDDQARACAGSELLGLPLVS